MLEHGLAMALTECFSLLKSYCCVFLQLMLLFLSFLLLVTFAHIVGGLRVGMPFKQLVCQMILYKERYYEAMF